MFLPTGLSFLLTTGNVRIRLYSRSQNADKGAVNIGDLVSKKYKGKLCVYCGKELSTTGDHVFAREFFLIKHRDGLPKVPACANCNGEKSALEHYLTIVLPFGARHSDAALTLQTMVPKRLKRNPKLLSDLADGFTGDKLPLRPGQVEKLFVFVARGLLWYHWKAILGVEDCVASTVFQEAGESPLSYTLSRLKPKARVSVNLGDSTFVYEGLQSVDSPQCSFWRFLVYGGLYFCEPAKDPNEKASLIFAVTGPRSLLPNFWATVFGESIGVGRC
jgi:hypothetical protein